MLDLAATNKLTRKLLARALAAGGSTTTLGDQAGRRLDASGQLTSGGGQVELADLAQTAQSLGLTLEDRTDATLIWGLRNAIKRDQTGASWLPSIAAKLVRKSYHLAVVARGAGTVQLFEAVVSPAALVLRSLDQVPAAMLVAEVDWDDFVRILATAPHTKDWRAWLHSPAISFRNEPLWLRVMLKLL